MNAAKWLAIAVLAVGFVPAAYAQNETPKNAKPPAKTAAPPAAPAPAPPALPEVQKPPSADDGEPSAPPPGTMADQPLAVLQALDKITARVKRLTVNVGSTVPFGTLTIEVDACRKAPPEDPPESAAFLKITDAKPGEAPQLAFSGWMFASSPALSAMDHPVYDIWVVDCGSQSTASATPSH